MADQSQEQEQLSRRFEAYLPTLWDMAQQHPLFNSLTHNDIRETWKRIPVGEQRGILLLAQLQQFLSNLTSRSLEEQKSIIERDIHRKGKESKFGPYTLKLASMYQQMVEGGELSGWWYVSQAAKTELERDLDESKVDWVLKRTDGSFVLVQSGTRPKNTLDKMRHLGQHYGEKFYLRPFIGTLPILDDLKRIPEDPILKSRISSVLYSTQGFTKDVIFTAFSRGTGKFGR